MLPLGATTPDPPEVILATIERHLMLENISDAQEYVEIMLRDHPGYLPAAIADAALHQLKSGSSERMLELLESTNSTLNKHWQYYSPWFEEEVEIGIERCRSNWANETQTGSKNVAPSNPILLFAFQSSFRTLLMLSPMIAMSEISEAEPVFYKRHIIASGPEELSEEQIATLIKSLSHKGVPTPVQMKMVASLSTLPADKGVPASMRLLESFHPLSALTAAETLCDYGKAALPAILASLREPSPDRRKVLEIYVLVRIGVYNSEIKEVLSSFTPSNPEALAYAPKALNFLSAKAGQSAAPAK
jgi:hypothetical protein